jgi:hypothetical protein
MKRLFVSLLASVVVLLSLTVGRSAYAFPVRFVLPGHYLADTAATTGEDWLTQLETEILPHLEEIFSPEQREKFKTDIANGTSFRKAFKSLTLTPEQKTQVKNLLSGVTKKDAFAALTPDQKKQLFAKKKDLFMPTSEEIADRIDASLKAKGMAMPEDVKQKIDAGLKQRDAFMPSTESIIEKIKASIGLAK